MAVKTSELLAIFYIKAAQHNRGQLSCASVQSTAKDAADMRAGVKIRRLIRVDAAEYHMFRQKQLAATPTAFTSMAAEETKKPVSWIK